MSDTGVPMTFETQNIEFEPSTGYVGTGIDFMPEPATAMCINAYVRVEPNGRVLEGYWLRTMDSSALVPDPQPVMHTFDFMKMSDLCAKMFQVCGRPDSEESRIGLGYTAYYNELARRLDPNLQEGPVPGLACSVMGYPERGLLIRFSTADASPTPVAALRGCLSLQGMHTLARGFRDMADWRGVALETAAEIAAELKQAPPEQRRGSPGVHPAAQQPDQSSARAPGR